MKNVVYFYRYGYVYRFTEMRCRDSAQNKLIRRQVIHYYSFKYYNSAAILGWKVQPTFELPQAVNEQ